MILTLYTVIKCEFWNCKNNIYSLNLILPKSICKYHILNMEKMQPVRKLQNSQCQSSKCTINASNTCLTHKTLLCNLCVSVLHSDCKVKIKDEEGFVLDTLDLAIRLAKMIDEEGTNYGLYIVEAIKTNRFLNINKI